MKYYPSEFIFSVSYTTRKPRETEVDTKDYFFIEKETFEKEIRNKNFLEHVKVHDNYYGTYRPQIESIIRKDKIALLDIDVQGVRQTLRNGLVVSYRIFIEPPSIEVLKSRLTNRKTENDAQIQRRINHAISELEIARKSEIFHSFIMNDDVEKFLKDGLELVERVYPFIKERKLKI